MIIYDISLILQYQVSTIVMDLIVVFLYCILFVFMLALLCFCVATEFSVNKDLYISLPPSLSDGSWEEEESRSVHPFLHSSRAYSTHEPHRARHVGSKGPHLGLHRVPKRSPFIF